MRAARANEIEDAAIRRVMSVRVKPETRNYSCFTRKKKNQHEIMIRFYYYYCYFGARRNFKWIFFSSVCNVCWVFGVCSHESFHF